MMLWNSAPKMAGLMRLHRAGVEQALAHRGVEACERQVLREQRAIDVVEGVELLVERLRPLLARGIQHLEQHRELRAEVAAVRLRTLVDPGTEGLRGLEDAGVVGEQAEQQAHEKHFERMAFVAAGLQRVVQLAHALGRAQVHRVLRPDGLRLVAGDEGEAADVLVQVGKCELRLVAALQIRHAQAREVGHEDVARQVALLQPREVVERLSVRTRQRPPARLVFDDQRARPEQVDEALGAAVLLDCMLEAGEPTTRQAENGEELVPERLRLGALVARVTPLLGEGDGAALDLVPAQRHGRGF
jgi:hypothetical protein